jgi:hypothetical protein
MNQKIQCLIDGGFITIEDIREYTQQYMDGVDQYDDEQIDKYYQEQYAENQARELDAEEKMLEDLYGQDEPEDYDYPFDITNNRSDDPEYIIASTSYKMEETYIFEANEKGEILNFGEYGGLCKRHGDKSWSYRDYAVDVIFPGKYERVKDFGEIGELGTNVFHSLYKRK